MRKNLFADASDRVVEVTARIRIPRAVDLAAVRRGTRLSLFGGGCAILAKTVEGTVSAREVGNEGAK